LANVLVSAQKTVKIEIWRLFLGKVAC